MGNVVDIAPRLESARTARLSEIHEDHVMSGKALELISEALIELDEKIINAMEIEYVE